jgi:hypothetical protein
MADVGYSLDIRVNSRRQRSPDSNLQLYLLQNCGASINDLELIQGSHSYMLVQNFDNTQFRPPVK